jgi:putative SOS response-associated peptidase YedK
MCGRFSFVSSTERIKHQLGEIETGQSLRCSYNIAPTQHAYVITNEQTKRLEYLIWGLIPHWSNDDKNASKLINARAEGIAVKPSFRVPIRQRRCLVLADSFYEWRNEGGRKAPYRILMKNGSLMLMAGIWDIWYKEGYAVKTFSIITTEANKEAALLHNRMPLILPSREQQERWLSMLSIEEVEAMLQRPPDGILDKYPVSDKVNSVSNNAPELHERIGTQPTLF